MPQLIGLAIILLVAFWLIFFIAVTFFFWASAAGLTFAAWWWRILEFPSKLSTEDISVNVAERSGEISLTIAVSAREGTTNQIFSWVLGAAVIINIVIWSFAGGVKVKMDNAEVPPFLVACIVTLVTVGCVAATRSWTPARLDACLTGVQLALNAVVTAKRREIEETYAGIDAEHRELEVNAPVSLATDIRRYFSQASGHGASILTPDSFGLFIDELLSKNRTYLESLRQARSAYKSAQRSLVQVGERADALRLRGERQLVTRYSGLLRKSMEQSVAKRDLRELQNVIVAAQAAIDKHASGSG